MADRILYRSNYKYQLAQTYHVWTRVTPSQHIVHPWIELETNGRLTIKFGYAWDGPSGPALDTKSFMRASLVHDALFQLMRLQALSPDWRDEADAEMHRVCREDGMSRVRAWYTYQIVRRFGASAASPASARPVEIAP